MNDQKPIDTTVNLWDYYFKIRVPYLQSRSMDYIKRYGVNITGIAEIDKDINNQLLTTMAPISTMLDYFKEGVTVRVVKASDTELIYKYISEHIHAWKMRLERGINIGDAPIDDLILMDKFANVVYEHAKYQLTPDILDSLMARQMNEVQRINAHNFFKGNILSNLNSSSKANDGITMINSSEEQLPDRDSLGEFFRNRLITLRR